MYLNDSRNPKDIDMNVTTKERKEERKKGRKEERKEGRKEGRKEERKEGRKKERKKERKRERKKEKGNVMLHTATSVFGILNYPIDGLIEGLYIH